MPAPRFVSPQGGAKGAAPVEVVPALHAAPDIAARSAVVRWTIARAALVRARPGLVSPDSDAPVFLELRVHGAVVEALVRDGSAEIILPAPGPARWIDDGEFTHIEAVGLSLTLRGRDVVYARSTALASLGLPGGRAELA